MSDKHRIMYVCSICADDYPEGCGHFDVKDLRAVPDGNWICENCYDDWGARDYGYDTSDENWTKPLWSSLPVPKVIISIG